MFTRIGVSESPIADLSGDDAALIAIAWLSVPILAEETYSPQKALSARHKAVCAGFADRSSKVL
jgi:hypothetical protein